MLAPKSIGNLSTIMHDTTFNTMVHSTSTPSVSGSTKLSSTQLADVRDMLGLTICLLKKIDLNYYKIVKRKSAQNNSIECSTHYTKHPQLDLKIHYSRQIYFACQKRSNKLSRVSQLGS